MQGIFPGAGRRILHAAGSHSLRNLLISIYSVEMMGAEPEGPDLRHAWFLHSYLHAEALCAEARVPNSSPAL